MNVKDQQHGLSGEMRRMKILEWLQEEGSARVRTLSDAFGVSEVTVRQDLEKLEQDGHVVREHGGAFLKSVSQQVAALALHHLVNMDAKRRIGAAAAALVTDGETIILDSGSTVTEVAKNLDGREGLTVITTAINMALMLGGKPSFDIHLTGGLFKPPTLSVSGETAAHYFNGLFAQKLFLATGAVSIDEGLTFPSFSDIPVKRAMIESANEVILVADSSKIGRRSLSALGGIDLIDIFVTDSGIDDQHRKDFEAAGIRVMVV